MTQCCSESTWQERRSFLMAKPNHCISHFIREGALQDFPHAPCGTILTKEVAKKVRSEGEEGKPQSCPLEISSLPSASHPSFSSRVSLSSTDIVTLLTEFCCVRPLFIDGFSFTFCFTFVLKDQTVSTEAWSSTSKPLLYNPSRLLSARPQFYSEHAEVPSST